MQLDQRLAAHLRRDRQIEERQHRRGDVLERAGGRERRRAADVDERHRVGGMRRVRLAGFIVEHLLGVAVIGGDEQLAARGLHRLENTPEAPVHRLDGLYRGVEIAAVADHVGIGVVADDDVVLIVAHRLHDLVGHLRRAHLGLEVVRRHVRGRGDEDAVLVLERRFDAAVEEERDMRIFLGLGDAQLAFAERREVGAHDIAQPLWRERHRHVEFGIVFGEAHERAELRRDRAREGVEVAIDERARDLARAVGAEIHEDQHVAVLEPHRLSPGGSRSCASCARGIGTSLSGTMAVALTNSSVSPRP